MATFDYFESEQPAVVEEPQVQPRSSGKVQIINKMSVGIDITLLDGSNLHVGPFVKGLNINKSVPVLRKHLPGYINRMKSEKKILVVDC